MSKRYISYDQFISGSYHAMQTISKSYFERIEELIYSTYNYHYFD